MEDSHNYSFFSAQRKKNDAILCGMQKKKFPRRINQVIIIMNAQGKKRWFPILMMMMFCRVFFVLFIVEIDRSIYKYLSGFQNIFGVDLKDKTKKMTMKKMKKYLSTTINTHIIQWNYCRIEKKSPHHHHDHPDKILANFFFIANFQVHEKKNSAEFRILLLAKRIFFYWLFTFFSTTNDHFCVFVFVACNSYMKKKLSS